MCGERDADGGGATGWLPAVRALRGGRRPCDEEIKMMEAKDDGELCKREEKMLPASRTAPAASAIKNSRAKKPKRTKDEHGFRGVHRRPSGRWGAEIRDVVKGFRVWIGTYDTVEAAALAYDAEARRIHGGNAKTNFPPTPPPADSGAVAKNNKKIKKQKAPVPAPTVAMEARTKTKPVPAAAADMVAAPIAGEWWTGEAAVAPVLLAHPLEATDGWEFEPYSMGLLGGVALLDINNAYADEPDDELWYF